MSSENCFTTSVLFAFHLYSPSFTRNDKSIWIFDGRTFNETDHQMLNSSLKKHIFRKWTLLDIVYVWFVHTTLCCVVRGDGFVPLVPGSRCSSVNSEGWGPERWCKHWYTPWNHFVTARDTKQHNVRLLWILSWELKDAIKKANVMNF